MIYDNPPPNQSIDQGDSIDGCPLVFLRAFLPDAPDPPTVDIVFRRVIVITQTCDLANQKTATANVAEVIDAQQLVADQILKPSEITGPIRTGLGCLLLALERRIEAE